MGVQEQPSGSWLEVAGGWGWSFPGLKRGGGRDWGSAEDEKGLRGSA